ncbi:hypothetical protein RHMOL_Rhmol08G0130400 [Rhododendron molle]|uniref:Uncharacterized protein n=1 Tax=Rhododendron molle TaxID=49168 RepID=A0ACC0MPV5_RHOML|nr:hypothetical protein RHMOL_Rhmol08G0130400 [Rhododendron molle]
MSSRKCCAAQTYTTDPPPTPTAPPNPPTPKTNIQPRTQRPPPNHSSIGVGLFAHHHHPPDLEQPDRYRTGRGKPAGGKGKKKRKTQMKTNGKTHKHQPFTLLSSSPDQERTDLETTEEERTRGATIRRRSWLEEPPPS